MSTVVLPAAKDVKDMLAGLVGKPVTVNPGPPVTPTEKSPVSVAVYVDLPGFLDAFGDSEAGWPVAVNVVAGLLSFGTWRWVNRRNSRPFAVVLLGLGIATVLVLASASYSRCPHAGLSSGWSVVTRVVGLLTNNYAVDMFTAPTATCEVHTVPLALQFADDCSAGVAWTQLTDHERLTLQTSQGYNRNWGELVVVADPVE